ncbi:hypothetical protein TNCV_4169661 [Trichonephila clavipes]|nr:hypothetical protein TNCV_4169661 [Trichonephila clavipes]
MDLVMLNPGQETRTTPELAPPSPNFYTPTTGGRSSLDIFNMHRLPLTRVLSSNRLELRTRQLRVRFLDHYVTAASSPLNRPRKSTGQGKELVAGVTGECEPEPLKNRHVEGLIHIKSVGAQASFRWYGGEARRGGASSGIVLVT